MNEQKQTFILCCWKKSFFSKSLSVDSHFKRAIYCKIESRLKETDFGVWSCDWHSQSQLTVVQSDCRHCCLSWFGEADDSDISRWKTACFVLCFTLGASAPIHAASLSLSSPMRSNQRRIDGIAVVYRLDFGGLFWLEGDFHPYLWQKCFFSPSLTFNIMNSSLTFW